MIARSTLTNFVGRLNGHQSQKAVGSSLRSWFAEVRGAHWSNPADVKRLYSTASIVGDRVVFNIKGNDYRLVVAVDYERGIVYVKWLGSHTEYDQIDVKVVEHGQ